MLNPQYYFKQMREHLEEYNPSRERSLAATKLEECEMWLAKCTLTDEARMRDMSRFTDILLDSTGWPVHQCPRNVMVLMLKNGLPEGGWSVILGDARDQPALSVSGYLERFAPAAETGGS